MTSKYQQGIARAVQYALSCGALVELTQAKCSRAQGGFELLPGQREVCGDQSGSSVKSALINFARVLQK